MDLYFRMPYLYQYSIAIPIYQGLLALFAVINFGLATFMDPGTYPRGKQDCQSSLVLEESNFEFRFRSIIQFSQFFIHRPQC